MTVYDDFISYGNFKIYRNGDMISTYNGKKLQYALGDIVQGINPSKILLYGYGIIPDDIDPHSIRSIVPLDGNIYNLDISNIGIVLSNKVSPNGIDPNRIVDMRIPPASQREIYVIPAGMLETRRLYGV